MEISKSAFLDHVVQEQNDQKQVVSKKGAPLCLSK